MCGYCVEGMMLEYLVEAKRKPQLEIDWLLPNYVQEVDDLIEIINKIKSSDYLEDSLDTIFCRLQDHFITHGHDAVLYNVVKSTIGPTLINKFFSKRYSGLEHNFSEELLNTIADPNIYEDETIWNEFVQNVDLTDTSEKCLKSYIDWGFGNNDEENWEKFDSIFPSLFFALSFLSKNKRDSNIIKKIALNTPDPIGNELWLQRKAFIYCVKEYGIEFIIENISKIRIVLISYTLSKITFTVVELKGLRKAISDRTGIRIVSSCEYYYLLLLIDDLILVKGETENLHTLYPNPITPNQTQKKYYCPNCNKFLFKGNVQKLNMVCSHCQKIINSDRNVLF